MPDSLANLSCRAFSEQLFSKAPVPGGGGAAALIGSLAAALGAMAANLTIGKKKFLPFEEDHRRIIAETDRLRMRLLTLMDEDAAAFEPLSRVYSLDKSSPGYSEKLTAATLTACKAPFEMMECCCTLIALLEAFRCRLRRSGCTLCPGIRLHECFCEHKDASRVRRSRHAECEGPGYAGGIPPPCTGSR